MKRILLALAVGVALFATVAFAASLGGITPGTLGADTAVVSSCDADGVTLSWGTHLTDHGEGDHPLGGFVVASVTVGGIADACIGKYVLMGIDQNGGHAQFCISHLIPGAEVTIDGVTDGFGDDCLNAVKIWAEDVTEVHIIIKDTPY